MSLGTEPDSRGEHRDDSASYVTDAFTQGRRVRTRSLWFLGFVGLIANVEVFAATHIGTLGPIPGLVFCLGCPTLLLRRLIWAELDPVARTVIAFSLAILSLMVVGLLIDVTLPLLGDVRPLSPIPLQASLDMLIAAEVLWYCRRFPACVAVAGRSAGLQRSRPRLVTGTLVSSGLAVVVGAAGAIRLNNNAGDAVSLLALTIVCTSATVLLWRGRDFSTGEVAGVLVCLGSTILLLIAMRGWFITGPDALGEYSNYLSVHSAARWSPRSSTSAYNACLSITILPQVLVSVTGISGIWIWKVIFPLCFAVTPVLVFLIAKTLTQWRTAILAALIFITFPTFVYSLAFAARQEIAFVFVGVSVLLMRNRESWQRNLLLVIALSGIVVSHYSTSYFFLATAVLGFVLYRFGCSIERGRLQKLAGRRRGATKDRAGLVEGPSYGISARLLLCFAVVLVVWEGPINGISGDVSHLAGSVYRSATGSVVKAVPARLSTGQTGIRARGSAEFVAYAASEERNAATAVAHGYYPPSLARQFSTTQVNVGNLPNTAVGNWMARFGVSPGTLNRLFRSLIARGLEVLAVVGVIAVLFRRGRAQLDLVVLAAANLVVIAVILVVPSLTESYGAARGFQQGLFVLAPFVALGLVRGLARCRVARSDALAGAISIASMISLVGLLPQITGGYVAQINLSNTGTYVASYFTSTEELAAVGWVNSNHIPTLQTNPFLAIRLSTLTGATIINDDFPDVLRSSSALFLGTSTIQTGTDITDNGDTYTYPSGLLAQLKSKIYANNGAAIYQ